MTMPVNETYVVVDADLDTADDDKDHSFHRACQGGEDGPKVAWCGAWQVFTTPPRVGPPPNACQECLPRWFTQSGCAACGA